MEFKVLIDAEVKFVVKQDIMHGKERVTVPMQFIIAKKRLTASDHSITFDYVSGKG